MNLNQRKFGTVKHVGQPWYYCLQNIKQRCNNPKNPNYKWYGKRGIKCFISLHQVHTLWIRDKAWLLKNQVLIGKIIMDIISLEIVDL